MKESGLDGNTLPYRNAALKQLNRGDDSSGRNSKWAPSSSYRGPRGDRSRSPKRSPYSGDSRVSQSYRGTMRLGNKEALDAVYSIPRDVVLLESCLTLYGQLKFLRLMQTDDNLETACNYLEIH